MSFSAPRTLAALGFSVLCALTAACGGSKPEAKAPTTEAAETTPVGSTAPAPVADGPTPELPKSIASTDNGSEIIPPFTASKEPASSKKSGPAGKSSQKKATSSSKPKKKG